MHTVTIEVSLLTGAKPADAAKVAQWIGEALRNPDTMDRDDTAVIHAIHVEESDA